MIYIYYRLQAIYIAPVNVRCINWQSVGCKNQYVKDCILLIIKVLLTLQLQLQNLKQT